jgi:hypothetical protein
MVPPARLRHRNGFSLWLPSGGLSQSIAHTVKHVTLVPLRFSQSIV